MTQAGNPLLGMLEKHPITSSRDKIIGTTIYGTEYDNPSYPQSVTPPEGTNGIVQVFQRAGLDWASVRDLLVDNLNSWNSNDDQAKDAYNNLLQLLLNEDSRRYNKEQQLDQRAYDATLLADQRAYDSPAAQIARLMQTGMSRDAALSFLSGSGSGSGAAGASSQLSSPQGSVVGATAPSSSRVNTATEANTYSNIVMNGLNTIANLASTGANMSLMSSQQQIAAAQAQIQQMSVYAMQDVGAFTQEVETLRLNDVLPQGSFNSVGHLTKALKNVSPSLSPSAGRMMSEIYPRIAANPYALQMLNDTFNSRWNTHGLKNNDDVVALAMRRFQAEALYAEINNDELVAEIANIHATTLKALSDIDVNNANITQTNAQTNLIGEQIITEGHKRNLIDAQTAESNARKMLTDAQINLTEAEFEQVKPYLIDLQQHPERYSAIATMGGISEYERLYFQTRGDQYAAREELARVTLEDKYVQAQFDYMNIIAKRQAQSQNPNLVKFNAWMNLWNQGAGQAAGKGVDAAGVVGTALKFIPK